jgi:thiamine kinase-like enzyme
MSGALLDKDQPAELEWMVRPASVSVSNVERNPAATFLTTILPSIPGWERVTSDSEFQVERLSGAMTNFVFRLWKVGQGQSKSKISVIIVRVYGQGGLLFSRRQEQGVFIAACRLGLGPQCLLQFANGRVEECLPGVPLHAAAMRIPTVSQAIARALADFHIDMYDSLSLVRDSSGPVGSSPRTDDTGAENTIWSRLQHWFRLVINLNDRQLIASLNVDRVEHHIESFKRSHEGLEEEYFGFCHNDLQCGNILLMDNDDNDSDGMGKKGVSVKLIDYEYSAVGDVAFDIANHFCEWAADYHATADPSGFILDWNQMPTETERYHFCRAYIQQIILNHPDSRLASVMARYSLDEATRNLSERAKSYEPISHLLWGLWGLVQSSCSEVDFDYLGYAKLRLQQLSLGI